MCNLCVPSVLWYCWLGLLTCKNRRPYNLYCVGGDVKPCSINQSCLHYKCLFYSNLPQTTINKAINDLRKRLHACVSADGEHFEHITWTRLSRLIWHNFVKVGYNCIKICNLAKIWTYNRCVKNRLKILNRLWKKWKMSCPQGGIFWTHTVYCDKLCWWRR